MRLSVRINWNKTPIKVLLHGKTPPKTNRSLLTPRYWPLYKLIRYLLTQKTKLVVILSDPILAIYRHGFASS